MASSSSGRPKRAPRRSTTTVALHAFDPRPSARFGVEVLAETGTPFALIGKVAMWALMPSREHEFTKDIDFAVQSRAIEPLKAALARRGVRHRALPIGGLAVRHGDVRVDFIDRSEGGLAGLFEEAIDAARRVGNRARVGRLAVPVVPVEYLVAMKIACGEDRDEDHALRLLRAVPDLDLRRTRDILQRRAGPAGANRLDALARRAGRKDARSEYRNSG